MDTGTKKELAEAIGRNVMFYGTEETAKKFGISERDVATICSYRLFDVEDTTWDTLDAAIARHPKRKRRKMKPPRMPRDFTRSQGQRRVYDAIVGGASIRGLTLMTLTSQNELLSYVMRDDNPPDSMARIEAALGKVGDRDLQALSHTMIQMFDDAVERGIRAYHNIPCERPSYDISPMAKTQPWTIDEATRDVMLKDALAET